MSWLQIPKWYGVFLLSLHPSPRRQITDRRVSVSGDKGKLTQLLSLLDTFELMFNIVEP